MAYLEEEEIEEKPDRAVSLASLTGALGRKPKEYKWRSTRKSSPPDPHEEADKKIAQMIERGKHPRVDLGPEEDRALATMRGEPVEETCVDCGKPRSIGSGQRCRECYLARAEAKRQSLPDGREGHVPPVPTDSRQGAAYKPLDLAEVEEVMATSDTMAKGAKRLGLTTAQLYIRRQKDEPVDKAVERGRERFYASLSDGDDDLPDEPRERAVIELVDDDVAEDDAVEREKQDRKVSPKKSNGRPRIDVDLQKFEDLLANPRLTVNEVCEGVGIKRNLIYDRKDVDPEFGAAYRRGMERREAAIANGELRQPQDLPEKLSKSPQNITETITVDENLDSVETQKQAMATVGQNGPNDHWPRFLDDGRLMEHAAEDYRDTQRRAQQEIERLRNLVNLIGICSHWHAPPALPPVKRMIDSLKVIGRELKRMEAYVEQERVV